MRALEEALGHEFASAALLEEALTHPSVGYESHRQGLSNQRLEFLGDAVLQLVLTDFLFRTFPGFDEGSLTKLRARLVSRPALAGLARRLDLGSQLRMGRGEAASGGRERASTLADAFEALIGAVFLDAGMETASRVILGCCAEELEHLANEPREVNPKGQLQETLQAVALGSPSYSIVAEEGPDHRKTFVARVEWNGLTLADGIGPSKKLAETAAAEAALSHPDVIAISSRLSPTTLSNASEDQTANKTIISTVDNPVNGGE